MLRIGRPAGPLGRRVAQVLVSLVLLALGGCGGTHEATAPTTTAAASKTPAAIDGCLRAGRGVRLTSFPAPGERVRAGVVGNGPIGVVFANQSGNSLCAWIPYARQLAGQGFRALLFDYGAGGNVDEVVAALRAVRRDGARSAALVGASLGGMVAVRVAARKHTGLDAVVTLSAERSGASMSDTLPYARRVHVPSLYVGTTDDGWTTFGADTRAMHRVTPARVNRMCSCTATSTASTCSRAGTAHRSGHWSRGSFARTADASRLRGVTASGRHRFR